MIRFLLTVKFLIIFIFSLSLLIFPMPSQAQDNLIAIEIISSPTCPHCNNAKSFFEELKTVYPDLVVRDYTLATNIDKAQNLYQTYNVPQQYQGLVPLIFINDQYFVGFSKQTEKEITQLVSIINSKSQDNNQVNKDFMKLPLLGEIDLKSYSLPVLAITLGVIDGFNVCSLGALVVILGLVMVLRSRRRIVLLGGTFLLTTGLIYALMIFAWHQLFTFISPYIRSFEILIGLLAFIGGIYLLREFYLAYKNGPVCSSNNIMSRLAPRIEKIFQNKTNWAVLFGTVVIFASLVTILEFPCSAVLPVLFTGILVEANISTSASIAYIALFMLFYLLDEIIIFIIAAVTMKIKIVSPRFIIFFNLLAALLFLFFGIFYLINSL